MEGAIMGIPAIAVSLVGLDNFHFEVAASFALKLARKVFLKGLPRGVVLNVNVPNGVAIQGHRFTHLGKHNYGDILTEKIDPRGRPYFWIGGNPNVFEENPGSDCDAFSSRFISVTPIKADLTDHHFLKELREWKL
jgi:5'-nucleotidase